MSTSAPNPALVAAAPVIISALNDLKQAVTTILTGNPALLPGRIAPAIQILDGQLVLLLPELASAEEPVALAAATGGLDSLIARVQKAAGITPAAG